MTAGVESVGTDAGSATVTVRDNVATPFALVSVTFTVNEPAALKTCGTVHGARPDEPGNCQLYVVAGQVIC